MQYGGGQFFDRFAGGVKVGNAFLTDLSFSPDSRRMAYVAQVGYGQVVVVDGNEGKQYDNLFRRKLFLTHFDLFQNPALYPDTNMKTGPIFESRSIFFISLPSNNAAYS